MVEVNLIDSEKWIMWSVCILCLLSLSSLLITQDFVSSKYFVFVPAETKSCDCDVTMTLSYVIFLKLCRPWWAMFLISCLFFHVHVISLLSCKNECQNNWRCVLFMTLFTCYFIDLSTTNALNNLHNWEETYFSSRNVYWFCIIQRMYVFKRTNWTNWISWMK